MSLSLQLPPRKLLSWAVIWSSFLLWLCYIFINLLFDTGWNTVAAPGMVSVRAAWIYWLVVQYLLPLFDLWFVIKMYPVKVCFVRIAWVDTHMNWLNRFLFLILKEALLVTLIGCLIFLSLLLIITRRAIPTICFLVKLDSRAISLEWFISRRSEIIQL